MGVTAEFPAAEVLFTQWSQLHGEQADVIL